MKSHSDPEENNNHHFFEALPVLDRFSQVSDIKQYHELPRDWVVVVADVVNSTGAIESGLYKEVNMVGVSVITAITNMLKPRVVPMVFGGDGASLCIPGGFRDEARAALVGVRRMALQAFSLKIRVGIVPVEAIISAGHRLLVARHQVSPDYIQAAFGGDGIVYAEELIKHSEQGIPYRFDKDTGEDSVDLSGLECRWNNIPSRHGETISLIVKVLEADLEIRTEVYAKVIAAVHNIYGDARTSSPVSGNDLHLTLNSAKLSVETRARSFPGGMLSGALYWCKIRFQTLLGGFLMATGITASGVHWGDYKKEVVANTDFRKFDGMLREVLAGTSEQREALTDFLAQKHQQGDIVYGIHVSTSALMTCMISERAGAHFHFVDGADGGYALAAAAMKRQLKDLETN